MQRGQLSVSVIGASQRFGNPVVSVSNIKYISSLPVPTIGSPLSISTVYLTSFQHFKISKIKNRTSNLGFLG
jgi:hypothetical protein